MPSRDLGISPPPFTAVLSGIVATMLAVGTASAQDVYVPRDTYQEQLIGEGNTVRFCYNADGMMAAFERDLADAISGILLVEAQLTPIPDTQISTPPLDFRLPLLPEQLYVVLAENCEALLGYALSASNPEWLSVTPPYFRTRTLFVAANADYERLEDVPLDLPLGARAMSMSDNRLIAFLQARTEDERWRRFPYYDNKLVLERVLDGTLGAGLVWEPALYFATNGDPEAAGYHILEGMPFQVPPTEIGIATRSDNGYLNATLATAIEALAADGTIAELLARHNLAPPVDAGGQ